MVENLKQTNILLCGSARVGKSTLINAICQRKLTKTSASLSSITKSVDRYSFQCDDGKTTHETVVWDTPGIESWHENDVRSYMAALIEQTDPLCMIYCASPNSFAILEHVAWLVSECHRKSIFCALVCTNMWGGSNRQEIVNEFCRVLSSVHPHLRTTREDGVVYYSNVALVTMVNSQEYVDDDFGVRKPASGVEELIFGIGKCLNRDLMFAWFRTVSQNTSFWSRMSSKLGALLHVPTETFSSVYEGASTFLDFLSYLYDFMPEEATPTKDTEEGLFHDAEMIELPREIAAKKLVFTFKSDEMKAMDELRQIMSNLGATGAITGEMEQEGAQCFTITAEFDDIRRLEAVQHLWQLASTNQINCSIAEEQNESSSVKTTE